MDGIKSPVFEPYSYGPSKAAVHHLTRNPSGRVGTMEDIAGLAIFLSSRAGAYTVGEVITCDGGSVASA